MEKPMAPDERDRRFDKALARHLRATAPSGQAAGGSPDSLAQRRACPDAETLAAYHERSLLPEESNSWKSHITACAHCQEVLAQLAATEGIPLQAVEKQAVPARQEAVPMVAQRNVEAITVRAPGNDQSVAGAVLPKKPRAPRSSGVRWRWLAPAGAIAAGLLVWIALRENRPLPVSQPDGIQVARNQEAVPPPPALVQPPASPPQSRGTISKPPSANDELTSLNGRAESPAAKQRQKLESHAESKPARAMASLEKESDARKDVGREVSDERLRSSDKSDLDGKAAAAGALQEKVELPRPAQSQTANDQRQNQYNYNAPKVPGPAPLAQAETVKKMKTAPPAPAPEAAGRAAAGWSGATATQLVSAYDAGLIFAPGSKMVWRAGRAGRIEFSADGGVSWSRQTSGVSLDLLTGAAPSDRVCWIVGRVGAILLTTDGGAHWRRVPAPISDDLDGIHATDALHATIWNVQNKKTFETSDGGQTWNRVAKE